MLGENIKSIRKDRKLTQKELGNLVEMHESTIRGYETGRIKPNCEMVEKLAKALDVDVVELYDTDEYMEKGKVEEPQLMQVLKSLVKTGAIENENAIDQETLDFIILQVKKEIVKIKEQEKTSI